MTAFDSVFIKDSTYSARALGSCYADGHFTLPYCHVMIAHIALWRLVFVYINVHIQIYSLLLLQSNPMSAS